MAKLNTYKKFLFIALLSFLPVMAFALDYTWDGGGDGSSWTNPLNWDLDSGYPGSSDTALFDSSASVTITSDITVDTLTFDTSDAVSVNLSGYNITASKIEWGVSDAANGVDLTFTGPGKLITDTLDTNQNADNEVTLTNYVDVEVNSALFADSSSNTTILNTGDSAGSESCTMTVPENSFKYGAAAISVTGVDVTSSVDCFDFGVSDTASEGITLTVSMKYTGTLTGFTSTPYYYYYKAEVTDSISTNSESYTFSEGSVPHAKSKFTNAVTVGTSPNMFSDTFTFDFPSTIDTGDGVLLTIYRPDSITPIGTIEYYKGANTWTGTNDTSWSDSGNWSLGHYPGSSGYVDENVLIPGSCSNYPIIASGYSGGSIGNVKLSDGASLTIEGAVTFDDLTLSSSSEVTTSAALSVSDITIESGSELTLGAALTASGAIDNDGTVISSTTGTHSFTTPTKLGNWEYTVGNANYGTYTRLTISGDVTALGALTTGMLTIDNSASLSMAGYELVVNASLVNNGTLRLQGNESTITLPSSPISGTVEYYGTGAGVTYSSLSGGDSYSYLIFNDTGTTPDTWQLDAGLSVANDLTITLGELVTGAHSLTVTGAISNSGTLSSSGSITCGDFTSSGAFSNTAANTISASGDVIVSGTFGSPANNTLTMTGTKTINTAVQIGNLTIASAASVTLDTTALDLAGNLVVENTGTINLGALGGGIGGDASGAGTLTCGSAAIDIDGSLTVSTVTASSGTTTIGGDFNVATSFTHNSGTVAFDSATAATISGSNTFYNLSCTVSAAKTLSFTAGTTQTIASGGTLTLEGASGNLLTLNSSSSGATWLIDVSNIATTDVSVDYVDISDSDLVGSLQVDLTSNNCTNGGNNDRYDSNISLFGADDAMWDFGAVTATWDGSNGTDWYDPENWSDNNIPFTSYDSAIIPAYNATTVPNMPVADASVTVGTLTLNDSTSTLSMAGNALTISSTYKNDYDGTLKLQGGETVTLPAGVGDSSTTPVPGIVEYYGDDDSTADTFSLSPFSYYDYLTFNSTDGLSDTWTLTSKTVYVINDFSFSNGTMSETGSTDTLSRFNITGAALFGSGASISVESNGIAFDVTGNTTINVGAGNDLSLSDTGNDFSTVEIDNVKDFTVIDSNAIEFASSNVSGNLSVTAAGTITDSGTLTVAGTVNMTANSGNSDITLDDNGDTTYTSSFGALSLSGDKITVYEAADTTIGSITANTSVTIISTGAINDATANTDTDFTTSSLTLSAVNGVGASAALETAVISLDIINTTNGNIDILEANNLSITRANQNTAGNIQITTTSGTISVDTNGITGTGSGSVTLTAGGSGNDIDINAAIDGGSGPITLSPDDTIYIGANITTAGDDASDDIPFSKPVVITGDDSWTISTGSGLGDIVFNSTINGEGSGYSDSLVLASGSGNIDFADTVGGSVAVKDIKISSAANVTFDKAVTASAVSIDLDGILIIPDTTDLSDTATTDFNLNGAFSQTSTANSATVKIAGEITTTDDSVSFASPVILTGDVLIDTDSSGGGAVTFNSTIGSDASTTRNLDIDAGSTGDINFDGDIGTVELAEFKITNANNVTADAAITANSIIQSSGQGITTFSGLLTTDISDGVSLTGTAFAINGGITTTSSGTVTITNSGLLSIGDSAADLTLDGAFSQSGTGTVNIAGGITTTADEVSFVSAVTLTGNLALETSNGNITFNSTVDGTYGLELASGSGALDFKGVVGGTTALSYAVIKSCSTLGNSTPDTIDFANTDLFIDADGLTVTVLRDLSVNDFYFYRGAVDFSTNSVELNTAGDFVIWGASYEPDDADKVTTPGSDNMLFAYPQSTSLPYYPDGGVYNSANGLFYTDATYAAQVSTNAAFTNSSSFDLTGVSITVNGNFYVNGADLLGDADGTDGDWTLAVQDSSTASPVALNSWGTPYAVAFNMEVSYCGTVSGGNIAASVPVTIAVDGVAGGQNNNCTDGGNNQEYAFSGNTLTQVGWDFSRPYIDQYETVFDNVLRVTFSEPIENSGNEISAVVANIKTNVGATAFTATYVDDDLTPDAPPYNFVSTDGKGDLTTFYLFVPRGTLTWNTDATGTSYGNSDDGSSDRDGNHQSVIADITMLKGLLFDAGGHNLVQNYGQNGFDQCDGDATSDTGETFVDSCRPALIAVAAGRADHSLTDEKIYDAHNMFHLRYSEPVTIGGLASGAENIRATETFNSGEWGGYIVENSSTVSVTGYFSYSGTYSSGSKDGTTPVSSLYRASDENPSGSYGLTIYVAGYRASNTAPFPGYLGKPSETLDSHSIQTDPSDSSLSATVPSNSFITDASGNSIEPSSESYRSFTDAAVSDPVITSDISDIAPGILSESTNGTGITMASVGTYYDGWDIDPPVFSSYVDADGDTGNYEIVSKIDSATRLINALEFFIRDNETAQSGWISTDSGDMHLDSDNMHGIRDSSFESYSAWGSEPYKAIKIGDAAESSLTSEHNSGFITVTENSIFSDTDSSQSVSKVDDPYFTLTINNYGHNWDAVAALQVTYDATIGLITDLAGNLIPSTGEPLLCVEKNFPVISLALASVGDNKIYVRFSEPVFGSGAADIDSGDFTFSVTDLSITSISSITRKNDGIIEAWLYLSSNLTANDAYSGEIIPVADSVFDKSMNVMLEDSIHRITDIGIG
ncbi:MAG: hypothetical protein PQJ46_02370, partial [Spirochaetales bacterium]|nr:hypothetical protein [Spirochaetales bacterium]